MNTCSGKGDTKMSSFKKIMGILCKCGNSPWKATVDNGTWLSGVKMLIRDLGDIGVSVAADSKEMETERKGAG